MLRNYVCVPNGLPSGLPLIAIWGSAERHEHQKNDSDKHVLLVSLRT